MSPASASADADDTLAIFAAGSLKLVFGALAHRFSTSADIAVTCSCGPSGTMRERIEAGGKADLFASADIGHPQRLHEAGLADEPVVFAGNRLCALVSPRLKARPDTIVDLMLDQTLALGMSTPGSDPSGDYAMQLFRKCEALRTGAEAALTARAVRLTGSPDSPKPPEGQNPYAWLITSGRADIFITYRTNGVTGDAALAGVDVVELPPPLTVTTDCAMAVVRPEQDAASEFAGFVLSKDGQAILRAHGFEPRGSGKQSP